MIKSNELRVGNWINYLGDNMKFNEIGLSNLFNPDNDIYGTDFEPIELTEEILLKCGFEKTIVNTMIKAWLNFSFYLTIRDDGDLFYEWKGGNIQVKYLHQLQNLYFSLHNKELEIEL